MKNYRILTLLTVCLAFIMNSYGQEKTSVKPMPKDEYIHKIQDRLKTGLAFSNDQLTQAHLILEKYAVVPANNSLNIVGTDAEREVMEIMTTDQAVSYKKQRGTFWDAPQQTGTPPQKSTTKPANSTVPASTK